MHYFKSDPTTHVMLFQGGRLKKQGLGKSFFHWPSLTNVVAISTTVQDVQFALKDRTADHQELAIQGDASYRITDPVTASTALDFRIDPRSRQYLTDDPEKIRNRIISILQAGTRDLIRALSLEAALVQANNLSDHLRDFLNAAPSIQELGVTVDGLRILHVTPAAETRKALEAEFRESLNQRADQAIYARRKSALDEERTLQETEMATEVEMEERRSLLVKQQADNRITTARAEAKAEEMKLLPFQQMPTGTLVAMALNRWAESGAEIGQLNLAPDMLNQLAGLISHRANHSSAE